MALNSYLHHRKILAVLLTLCLIYELAAMYYVYVNKDFIIAQLGEISRTSSVANITYTFFWSYAVDI